MMMEDVQAERRLTVHGVTEGADDAVYQYARRRGLGVDQVMVAEIVAAKMMIEIDQGTDTLEGAELFTRPAELADIQDKSRIEIAVGDVMNNAVGARQENVQLRNLVTQMDADLFSDLPEKRGQGQGRTDSIAIRSFVTGDQERGIGADYRNNILNDLIHARIQSP